MLREFTDKDGNRWRVWDVTPLLHTQRSQLRTPGVFADVPEGWLCFESGTERRRLSPIPVEWPECDDAALEDFRSQANVVPRIVRDFDTGEAQP
jgi:hypothetical protein